MWLYFGLEKTAGRFFLNAYVTIEITPEVAVNTQEKKTELENIKKNDLKMKIKAYKQDFYNQVVIVTCATTNTPEKNTISSTIPITDIYTTKTTTVTYTI